MGTECGTAIGQSIVSGVRLFQAAQKYSYDVGYAGDYGKPFSDIMAVGNALNDHWSQLPPREQEQVKYKFITEMIADGAIGAAAGQTIGKAKTFTEVLDAVADRAADLAGVSKKELRHLTEEQLEARGLESIQKHYDRLFYDKHPQLKGTDTQVHHALP
jgi:hypothetical protein